MPIRVLIVDDSAIVRQVLQEQLKTLPDIEVMAVAPDPLFALEKMKKEWPDVIILDIEMPRMDGISFLRQLNATRPTPVIICSSLAEEGADATLQALEEGAFAIITKPKIGVRDFLREASEDLGNLVRAAAQAKIEQLHPRKAEKPNAPKAPIVERERFQPKLAPDVMLAPPSGKNQIPMTEQFVAIGCSTGGTLALESILLALPRTCPGIVVVQHMPGQFTRSFAERLDRLCAMEVREARDGDRILPGLVLIAPGGKHLLVQRNGSQYRAEVKDGPLVSRHRPSVDILFRSVAKAAGRNAIGIIMTGMGDDGARGLKEMHDTEATTYAQDEATCVVFGMPKEAIRLGGVDHVVALDSIPQIIQIMYNKQFLEQ
jgi:two-component system, chemotaxis family, protein-glutamate methylesterase/glutaminase